MSIFLDKKLVEKCKRGNKKALETLYKTTADFLLGICMRYAQNKQDAEDIFQEGFIKILHNLNNLKENDKIVPWMIRIMANTAINYLKAQQRLGENEFNDNTDFNTEELKEDNDDLLLDMITVDELYELIGQLPQGYKTVINLYAIENYSHKEIANMLGISESTSKTQYQKAKAKLKKMIMEKLNIKDEKQL